MTTLSWTFLSSTLAITLAATTATPQSTGLASVPPSEVVTVRGDQLSPAELGPGWVESMDEVVRRDLANPAPPGVQCVPEPESPFQDEINRQKRMAHLDEGGHQTLGGSGSIPIIGTDFVGPASGDAGGFWIPPDTCGAIGPNHFVSIVNANVSVWNKTTGARLVNVGEQSFWGAAQSLGDGRAVYDPNSGRFILIGTSFNSGSRIYLAVSATSDPTGAWFKAFFTTNGGSDAGTWPDYPTLGVDANGVYMGVYAVGAGSMTIFALDKAPLVAGAQSLGTITAFRGLNWEGAIQPCVTHGNPGVEYLITYSRIYRVNPPLNAPSLTQLGNSDIGGFSAPPDAPNMGGSGIDTLDGRLMNAVYRNGRIWTTHAVNSGGRSAVKWYEIDPLASSPNRDVQVGVIDDPSRHYYAPGISANAANAMVVGFSGSHSGQFASAYVAGRKSTDTPGQTGAPVLLKAGEGGYFDGRWGDYSLTSVDPTNDTDFWTIQEYARNGGNWGTWIGQVIYDSCVPVTPTNFCTAAPNSTNPSGAVMGWTGSNSVSQNNFVLQTFGAPPNKTCLYMYAQNQSVNVVFGNGFRCIANPIYRLNPIQTTDAFGDVFRAVDVNFLPFGGEISAGESWGFMLWYRDFPAGGAFFNASDGLSTTWCP